MEDFIPIYKGPERRKDSRRQADECMFHEAHEVRFGKDEEQIRTAVACIVAIKDEMKTKVPMKLFYTLVGLIVIILSVQWQTYQTVNQMAFEHEHQMGEINITVAEVKAEVRHGNILSTRARSSIKEALEETTKKTERQFDAIKKQIEKLNNN